MSPQPVPQDARRELEMLLASHFPLILVESREEARVVSLIREAGQRAGRGREWGVYQWSATDGLRRIDAEGTPNRTLNEPAAFLRHLKSTTVAGVYVLCDFHPYLSDPINVRLLKDVAQSYEQVARTIVLISHEVACPQELEHLTARVRFGLPSRNERHMIVMKVADQWTKVKRQQAAIDAGVLEQLVDNLAGLDSPYTERLARQALFNDGALTAEDLPLVLAAKYQLLNRGGTLTYEPDTAKFAEIGGLSKLRPWLQSRKVAFDGTAPGLDPPKGMVLLGVQGCGKSLACRAAAGILGVPLLRLDFGSLYSKWHGESEKNLRESLRAAEALAPCVLWIDEMDKAIATGEGDSGVSRRVLGTFLTWLAEQRARVFIVATANDIKALPPELVRKGRFDEIFFVDLPSAAARLEILGIHCKKRDVVIGDNDMKVLATRCEGFSGAEIEQAVVSALYTAHANDQRADARLIAAEIDATKPLSVVLGEKVEELREWARERTVPAD